MRHRLSALLTGAVLALAVACGDDNGTGPGEANITGSYTLQTLNGQAPPVTILEAGTYRLEITAGAFTINANNTFSSPHTFRETDAGETTTFSETCTGTYTRTGTSLSFNEAESGETCGGTYTGSVSGNNLTVAYDASLQAVYRR